MKNLLFLVFLAFISVGFSQNNDLFEQGKQHYKEANYEAAIKSWKSILDSGEHSAALYFNLGNAYFKSEQIAPSIYFYEKALKLAPGDSEIKNNLTFAQNQTIDLIESLPQNKLKTWINKAILSTSFDNWAWITVAFVFGFTILFLIYFFSKHSSKKRIFFTATLFLMFFALVSLFITHKSYTLSENLRSGIVFSESTQVRSEPVNRSEISFVLHEGTKVEIISEEDEWVRIKLADGKDGWMLKTDLKEI